MNKRYALISVAVLMALLVVGTGAVAKQPPAGEGPPKAADVSVGEPGTVFRYVETFGVTEMAYFADSDHLNRPNGIGLDGAGNLWVAEGSGYRALKYNSAGTFQMSIGTAGLRSAGEDTFAGLGDVGVDPSGNVWVADGSAHRVVKFDSSGNYLDQIGVDWETGTDNDHLNWPAGIAFDESGNVYISDGGNHRAQIFDSSGVYNATLGESGVSGSDNAHFNCLDGLAVDSSGNIYVADEENHRVQIFDSAGTYNATLGTGACGTANNQLCWPSDVAVDSSGNIYVADSSNHRVQILDSSLNYIATLGQTGVSGSDNAHFNWPEGVAVDSNGNIYVSERYNYRVQKFNSGRVYQYTIGTTGVPYVTDNNHFNGPHGVAVDSSGNIIFSEERGHRLLKLNSSGVPQWAVGEPGVAGADNAHFSWLEGVAVDSSGNIYVADKDNHRVQIYDSAGNYVVTLGAGQGDGNYQFQDPSGVTIGPDGYIYVADTWNHRIQIYNSSRVYVATLGVTGSSGTDNAHFNAPRSVLVDSNGNIYVADGHNDRVQVFDSNHIHQYTIGTTGECGDDFDHFCGPYDVAVDASGRIYVADRYNHRVQVFDSSGAYLPTIGGAWGSEIGRFREPCGVDVDAQGNVYVTDWGNHRIQKFARGVPWWRQVNINGFGDRDNTWITLAAFNNSLYAATLNRETGAQLWRIADGTDWTQVNADGFGDANNVLTWVLVPFGGYLYAGIENSTTGCEVWCSNNGTTWNQANVDGFGNPNNKKILSMAVFGNHLYAGTVNLTEGCEIWRTDSGITWTQVISGGFNDTNNGEAWGMAAFENHLYVGTKNETTGGEIWRTSDGNTWHQVNLDGFGDSDNKVSTVMEAFNIYLYAGTWNDATGTEVWRSSDGATWNQVNLDGFGDTYNKLIWPGASTVFEGEFYVGTQNYTGCEIWKTSDGITWSQIAPDGFGDSNNGSVKSIVAFGNRLYIGTGNGANGGEVWRKIVVDPTPLALSADSGYASIQLSWNPASDPGVTAYRISRRLSSSPDFTVINTVSDTVYFDSDGSLTPGTSYCYQVEALRSDETVVGTSNEACATFGQVDLWVPDTWAAPGETVIVPVNVRNADGLRIAAADVWLDFDPTVIEPVDVSSTALTEQYAWSHAIHSSGTYSQVRIATIASPPPVLYGDGSLFWFTFSVLGSADDTSPLNLREFIEGVGGSTISTLDEFEDLVDVPLFLQDGTLYVATTGMLGDVDGNGVVGAADAYLALQMAVGKKTPDWQQQYAGDVNGDGVISSADVTMILYYAAHQDWPLPSGGTQSPQTVVLSLDDVSGAPGTVVTTTLRAADLQDWAGGDWIIAYDPTLVAEVTQVNVAGLSEGAPFQFYDDGAGLLRIAVAKGSAVSGDGALATISLRLASTPACDSGSLTMATAKLNDVYGRDFSTSALQRTVIRQNGTVGITRSVYLPLVLRNS